MTPEQWTLVERLYDEASSVPASDRDAWLARACDGDELVKREVESLLAQNASTPNALDDGAMAQGLGRLRGENLTGRQLGGYTFLALIDEGGMGQVYRARDGALPRDVAVKVITPEFADDPVRRARFRREASLLASLAHPHIAHVYSFVEADGRNLLAMELVSGETLAAVIRRGPLAIGDVLGSGAEIADALAEAHGAGIVHRDLKPGNVMITSRGVKVLDFGLARQDTATSPQTVTAVLGTPAYMAPEQVLDKQVDARADLFSLGLLLYEMTTGRLPVPGASLGSILASDPSAEVAPPSKSRAGVSSKLDALVSSLLAADPASRPASAADVRDTLRILAAPKPSTGSAWGIRAAAAAAVLVAAGAGGWWAFIRTAPMRVEVARTDVIISSPGDKADPALSPDGTTLAFSWRGENRNAPGIYLIATSGGTPRRLTQSATDDISPVWDPAGTRLAFVRLHPGQSQEILVVPVSGGAEEKVRELEWPEWLRRTPRPLLAWTPDGTGWIVPMQDAGTNRYSLYRISRGQAPRLFAKVGTSAGLTLPIFSRDGRWFTYAAQDPGALFVQAVGPGGQLQGEANDVMTFADEAGRRPQIEPDSWANSPTLSPDGTQLWFTIGSRIVMAQPALHRAQVAYTAPSHLEHLTAHWGRDIAAPVIVFATASSQYEIRRVDTAPAGRTPAGPGELLAHGATPALSPDGQWLAFASLTGGGLELFLSRADGTNPRQLTRLRAVVVADPDWAPDGRRVAFHARLGGVTEGRAQVYVTEVDAPAEMARTATTPSAATTRRVTTHSVSIAGPRWTPDGQVLYATQLPGRIVRVNPSTGEVEDMFVGDMPRPDGSSQRLYYGRDGQFGLFARSLTGDVRSNQEERILSDYVPPRGYGVTSKGIFYLGRDAQRNPVAIRFYDFALRKSVDVAPAPRGAIPEVTASRDGRYVLFDTVDEGSTALTAVQIRETGR